jgi:hypothetical protein
MPASVRNVFRRRSYFDETLPMIENDTDDEQHSNPKSSRSDSFMRLA